jgi:hypothetical protein
MAAGIAIWSLGALYCGAQAAKRIYSRWYGQVAELTPAEKELEEKAEELLVEAMTPPRKKNTPAPAPLPPSPVPAPAPAQEAKLDAKGALVEPKAR